MKVNRCLACTDELAAVLDCIEEPAILVNPERVVLTANSAYRNEFCEGRSPAGRHCYEVSHGYASPCDQVGERCPLRTCGRTGRPSRVVHVHASGDGEEHQDVTAFPVKDSDGQIRAYLETIHRAPVASTRPDGDGLVGRSPAFNRMLELIQRAAPSETTVLLLGESGTGKELVAKTIHRISRRSTGPFVPVECSGLSETLFESELFGHEKGAFTGAFTRKTGLVEAASGGTLFLDEVGDIPVNLQVKLLRLLETGSFRRVGSVESSRADFRLICATHRDLRDMVDAETFRRDLYFRISAFPVPLPPLRERIEDLPLLIDTLLKRIDPEGHHHIDRNALATLYEYDFPGNVRELLNILERGCLLADGDTVMPENLPDECYDPGGNGRRVCRGEILTLSEVERRYLRWAVAKFQGDKSTLARELGLGERTLYRKLRQLRDPEVPGAAGAARRGTDPPRA